MATERQVKLGVLCGIDVAKLPRRAAAAALQVALAEDVLGVVPVRPTTESQKQLASQLALTDLSQYREIAAIQIRAALACRDEEALRKDHFAPGMRVRFVGGPTVYGHSHSLGTVYTVSKVTADCKVYFRRTRGAFAYTSQLEPVS